MFEMGPNEPKIQTPGIRLGKLAAKVGTKQLLLKNFLRRLDAPLPKTFNAWKARKPFPLESWGNDQFGDCTIASQANGVMRMERVEQKNTVVIPDQNVIETYFSLTKRKYGDTPEYKIYNGDTGAFETDALDNWRDKEHTFKDAKGRAYTIDAYAAVNHRDIEEMKRALFSSAARGIKVCFLLPPAFEGLLSPKVWDIPAGQPLLGDWAATAGHSMWAEARYDETGFWVAHTWKLELQKVTWAFGMAYMDEAYSVFDSLDYFRKIKSGVDTKLLAEAVNDVSKIKVGGFKS
jgi:hypothetical protein